MAARQASIKVEDYRVFVHRDSRTLVLTDHHTTGPISRLELVFTDPLPPFRGKLINSGQAHCYVPLAMFGDAYHVVQTEKPVYAYAWWDDADNTVFDAGITTDPEPPGEGLADPRGRF